MRIFLSIIASFIIISCNTKKYDYSIIWTENISSSFWENKKFPCFNNKRQKSIILTSSIISNPRNPYNIYHYGYDTVILSSICNYDAISLSPIDLTLSFKKIMDYMKNHDNLLATNVYIKFNMKSFKKYIDKDISGKKLLVYSIITDDSNPLKSFHEGDYRVENPSYEINKLNSNIKPNQYLLIIRSKKQFNKRDKNYFKTLIENLDKKPQAILCEIDKKYVVLDVPIVPLPHKDSEIKVVKKFGCLKFKTTSKIENNFINIHSKKELEDMIEKTKNYLDQKLLKIVKSISKKEMNYIIAKGISNFITCDVVIISNHTIRDTYITHDILIKDLYEMINDPEDKLVYIKIKGEKLNDLINQNNNSTLYIKQKHILNGKVNLNKTHMYKLITTTNYLKENDTILNLISEFSILDIKITQPIIWYFRKIGKVYPSQ